jgi:hypothetical protein
MRRPRRRSLLYVLGGWVSHTAPLKNLKYFYRKRPTDFCFESSLPPPSSSEITTMTLDRGGGGAGVNLRELLD